MLSFFTASYLIFSQLSLCIFTVHVLLKENFIQVYNVCSIYFTMMFSIFISPCSALSATPCPIFPDNFVVYLHIYMILYIYIKFRDHKWENKNYIYIYCPTQCLWDWLNFCSCIHFCAGGITAFFYDEQQLHPSPIPLVRPLCWFCDSAIVTSATVKCASWPEVI